MSEKRFKLDFDNCNGGCIMDREDRYGQYCKLYDFGEIGKKQIVNLLNSLSEEKKKANAFIVEKGLELEFIEWCRE